MTMGIELLAALHESFPGIFPDVPPRPVPRPRSLFRPSNESASEQSDPPAFSAISSIIGFLPFLEPAINNPALANHTTYRSAVLQSFDQSLRDTRFIYPLEAAAHPGEPAVSATLEWVAASSIADLRRFMCRIATPPYASSLSDNVVSGVVQAILKRIRDATRSPAEELAMLLLSYDLMGIDYGYSDEYMPEAVVILKNLPQCDCQDNVLTMVNDVFQRWFHDDRPKEQYETLSTEIWSWFQIAVQKCLPTKGLVLTRQQADELNQLFYLDKNVR